MQNLKTKKPQYKSVIILRIPEWRENIKENEFYGNLVNYYCGKIKWQGHFFDEWDLDISYAKVFTDKIEAKKTLSKVVKIIGQSEAKLVDYWKELNKKRKLPSRPLPSEKKDQNFSK